MAEPIGSRVNALLDESRRASVREWTREYARMAPPLRPIDVAGLLVARISFELPKWMARNRTLTQELQDELDRLAFFVAWETAPRVLIACGLLPPTQCSTELFQQYVELHREWRQEVTRLAGHVPFEPAPEPKSPREAMLREAYRDAERAGRVPKAKLLASIESELRGTDDDGGNPAASLTEAVFWLDRKDRLDGKGRVGRLFRFDRRGLLTLKRRKLRDRNRATRGQWNDSVPLGRNLQSPDEGAAQETALEQIDVVRRIREVLRRRQSEVREGTARWWVLDHLMRTDDPPNYGALARQSGHDESTLRRAHGAERTALARHFPGAA